MGIDISMTGSGSVGDIVNWSGQEDSTPVSIGDSSGSTGLVSVTARTTDESVFIVDNVASIAHETLGSSDGIVTGVSVNDAVTSFGIKTSLSLLNVDATMPAIGPAPLDQIFSTYVFAIAPSLSTDFQATLNPERTYRGWRGNGWDFLKQLCAANNVELAVSGTQIIIRDIGSRTLPLEDYEAKPSLSLETDAAGRAIDIFYDNSQAVLTTAPNLYNYSGNPSLESNLTDWSASVTTGTIDSALSRINTGIAAFAGSWKGFIAFRTIRSNAPTNPATPLYYHTLDGTVTHRVNGLAAIADGVPYDFSVRYYSPATNVTNQGSVPGQAPLLRAPIYVTPTVRWYNASNVLLSTTVGSRDTMAGTPVAWRTGAISSVKPVGATYATLSMNMRMQAWNDNAASAAYFQQLYFDGVMVTSGGTPYFDGSFPGAAWSGTANNSASVKAAAGNVAFYDAYADDNAVYTVGVGETNVITIQTENYPNFLAQPIQTNSLPLGLGSYIVSGSNGVQATVAEWQAFGGSVNVAVGDEPGSIILTIVGPRSAVSVPPPYSLSVTDSDKTYATLNVIGTGVVTKKEKLTLLTGADPVKTTNEIATSVDSPFINTLSQAYDRGVWASIDASGPTVTLTVSLPTSSLQGFGLTQGSLIRYKDSIYRVRSVQPANATTTITAAWYVKVSESDDVWTGQTAGTFDTSWANYEAQDFQIAPLKRLV